jgi:hypothetical protein
MAFPALAIGQDARLPYSSIGYNNNNFPPNIIEDTKALRAKRNAGALAKCDPVVMTTILDEIETGKTVAQACQKAKVSEATYYRWCVLLPDFKEMVSLAQKSQSTARMYKHQHDMEVLDVDSLDPKLAMAHLRRQEQAARLDLEIAKRRDHATWGDKQQNLNMNVNVEVPANADLSGWLNR